MPADLINKVNISVDGISIKTYINLEIDQNINAHHQFKLVLGTIDLLESMGEGDWNTPINEQLVSCRKCIGKKFRVEFSVPNMKGVSGNTFEGFVTNISIARNFGKKLGVVLTGYSPTIMASKGLNCVSFEKMTLSDIFKKVLGQYSDIKTKISPAFTKKIEYTVQYRESDFNFLSRLAQRYGEWFYYDGQTLNLGPPKKGTAVELKLGKNLDSFDWSLNLEHAQFEQDQYNYLSNELFKSSSKGKSVSGLSDFGDFTLKESDKFYKQVPKIPIDFLTPNKNILQDVTTTKRQMLANNLVEFKGESIHPDIETGAIINAGGAVAGVKMSEVENYGEFIVTEVSHHIHINGTYYNTFVAIPANVKIAPINPNIIPANCEVQVAVVKKNVNDPDKLGRVRVNFYWQESSDLSPWLRIVTPHAGKSKGMYFIPEEEEEVLVGFENGDPERPFIHGSFFHKKQGPGFEDPKNYVKGIRTVSKNEIMFNDEPGKETIMIFNKENKNEIILTLDESGKIRIKTDNLLEMEAKDITMKASNNMSIEVGKNLDITVKGNKKESIKGNDTLNVTKNKKINAQKLVYDSKSSIGLTSKTDTKIQATSSFDVTAAKEAKIQAGKGVEIKAGGTAKIQAGGSAEMQAGGKCEIKGGGKAALQAGGMLDIKAAGIIGMMGSLVKIN